MDFLFLPGEPFGASYEDKSAKDKSVSLKNRVTDEASVTNKGGPRSLLVDREYSYPRRLMLRVRACPEGESRRVPPNNVSVGWLGSVLQSELRTDSYDHRADKNVCSTDYLLERTYHRMGMWDTLPQPP